MITNRPEFSLIHLSDGELLSSLGNVLAPHRRATAQLIAHLAEMDARKLYLSEATSSLFVYCVQRLGFGEDEACRRIDAARLAQRFPIIYGMLESGEVSLSVLGRLKPFIDVDNAEELLALVRGKSVREAERLLAGRFPKPDVPDRIRKLPDTRSSNPRVSEPKQTETCSELVFENDAEASVRTGDALASPQIAGNEQDSTQVELGGWRIAVRWQLGSSSELRVE